MKTIQYQLLLVEGNPSDAELLQTAAAAGCRDRFKFTVAGTLPEAEKAARDKLFDAVLLDLNLRGSRGPVTVRKAAPLFPSIPVIALTENDDEQTGNQALWNGAADYLPKTRADGKLLLRCIRYSIEKTGSELERKRLNRTLEAISKSNQAIVLAENEKDYLQEVCRIIHIYCSYAAAGISFLHSGLGGINPMAYDGIEKEYFEIPETSRPDTRYLLTAFRTGTIGIYKNIPPDPNQKSAWKQVMKWDFQSLITLPLREYKKTFGVLAIYSRQPDPFTGEEVKLLSQLAGDLDNNIHVLRQRSEQDLTRQALVESEARYRSLFNTMSEGFALHGVICNENGKMADYIYLQINPAYEAITGLHRDKVIGCPHSLLKQEDDPETFRVYERVALSGKPESFEKYYPLHNKYYEVFVYSPDFFQFAVLMEDITARKQAEAFLQTVLEERYRALAEVQTELILRRKPDGKVTFVNEAYSRFFKIAPADLLGNAFFPAVLQTLQTEPCLLDLANSFPEYLTLMKQKEVLEYQCMTISGSRQIKWIAWIDKALFNDKRELIEIQSVGLDITEKKELEADLREKQRIIESQKLVLRKAESANSRNHALLEKRGKFLERFTEREKEIITLLVNGLSYKEISTRLNICEKTVDTHAQNIYHKAEVSGRGYLIGLFSRYYETEPQPPGAHSNRKKDPIEQGTVFKENRE